MAKLIEATKNVAPTPVRITLEFGSLEELQDVVKKVGRTDSYNEKGTEYATTGDNWFTFYDALKTAEEKVK